VEAQLALALQYRTDGDYDRASELLTQLHDAYPNHARINYHLAWLHDQRGEERDAIPYYESAIELGLSDEDLRGALLGLGSTYRCVGAYEQAAAVLQRGVEQFPEAQEYLVFLAMTLYNLDQHDEAIRLLLKSLAATSRDAGIERYQKAILFYADRLDEVW
jgi:tetratricopeptide (TPR) repeat protein